MSEANSTAKQFVEECKVCIRQRIDHPLAISFLVSFFAVNWRIIAILLLSKESIEVRLEYVELFYTDHLHYLVLPAAIAFIYAFVLPWFGILTAFISCEVERRKMLFEVVLLRERKMRDEIASRAEEVRPKNASEIHLMAQIATREKALENIQQRISQEKDLNTLAVLKRQADETATEIRKLRDTNS